MEATITEEHRWLHQLVGEWRVEGGTYNMGADGGSGEMPPGTDTVRKLGDAWLICDGRSQMPASEGGGTTLTQMTLGYDPAKGHFVGTFIGSMMNHLWVYRRGTLDAARRALTLEAEGPAFAGPPGSMAQYRDTIEIIGPDERLLYSEVQGTDGQWTRFMTMRYRRVK